MVAKHQAVAAFASGGRGCGRGEAVKVKKEAIGVGPLGLGILGPGDHPGVTPLPLGGQHRWRKQQIPFKVVQVSVNHRDCAMYCSSPVGYLDGVFLFEHILSYLGLKIFLIFVCFLRLFSW